MISLDISQFRRRVGQIIFWVSRRFRSFVRNQNGSPFWFFRRHFPHSGRHFYKGGTDEALGSLIREGCWDPDRSLQVLQVLETWTWQWDLFHLAMDQYLLIPFLVGWTSIYQLFWCSPGVQGFDPSPFRVFSSHLFGVYADLCRFRVGESQHVSTGVRTKNRQDDDATDLLRSNASGLRVLVSTPPFLHIPLWNRESRWS